MKTNSKKQSVLKVVSKIAFFSAKKGCGAASLASYHQPKEPTNLASRLTNNEKRRNKNN